MANYWLISGSLPDNQGGFNFWLQRRPKTVFNACSSLALIGQAVSEENIFKNS